MGSPHIYTPELADEVLRRIATGESVRQIGRCDGMPDDATFLKWVTVHGLSRQYAQAREAGWRAMADQLMEIADAATEDDAAARRLQVDTRKWLLSKMLPKVYGDRLDVNVSGELNITAMPDEALSDRVEARLRARLGPVFESIEHPTLEDCLRPFRVTPLPITLIAEDVDG